MNSRDILDGLKVILHEMTSEDVRTMQLLVWHDGRKYEVKVHIRPYEKGDCD